MKRHSLFQVGEGRRTKQKGTSFHNASIGLCMHYKLYAIPFILYFIALLYHTEAKGISVSGIQQAEGQPSSLPPNESATPPVSAIVGLQEPVASETKATADKVSGSWIQVTVTGNLHAVEVKQHVSNISTKQAQESSAASVYMAAHTRVKQPEVAQLAKTSRTDEGIPDLAAESVSAWSAELVTVEETTRQQNDVDNFETALAELAAHPCHGVGEQEAQAAARRMLEEIEVLMGSEDRILDTGDDDDYVYDSPSTDDSVTGSTNTFG
jgi:hypothetical protein